MKIISKPAMGIIMEYWSDQLGCQITSPKQKARILKERGLSEAPPMKEMNHTATEKPYTLED